jgi:hypothetical protein
MDVGAVWLTIKADVSQAVNGIEQTKASVGSLHGSVKESRTEFRSFMKDMAFVALPITVGYAMLSREISKLTDQASSIRKISNELNITVEAAQRLEAAKHGLYNQPMFTDKEVTTIEGISTRIYAAGNALDVYFGKYMAWSESRFAKDDPLMQFPETLGNIGKASQETAADGKAFDTWLKKLAEDAADAAEKIARAKQSIKDLSQEIKDAKLDMRGGALTQADVRDEYSALYNEIKHDELIIGHDPETSQARELAAALPAKKRRLANLQYQNDVLSAAREKDQDAIDAAYAQNQQNIKIIIDNKSIVDVQAQIKKDSETQAWYLARETGINL